MRKAAARTTLKHPWKSCEGSPGADSVFALLRFGLADSVFALLRLGLKSGAKPPTRAEAHPLPAC